MYSTLFLPTFIIWCLLFNCKKCLINGTDIVMSWKKTLIRAHTENVNKDTNNSGHYLASE